MHGIFLNNGEMKEATDAIIECVKIDGGIMVLRSVLINGRK